MKKIMALFAVLLVAVMIFACGKEGGGETTGTKATTATTTAATTTASTTATTKPTSGTTATTQATTQATTTAKPEITTGLYVDVDFANGKVTDSKGNATFTITGTPIVGKVEVTFNGVTKKVDALHITSSGSWVKGVLSNVADATTMNEMLAKGWTVEAFYLDNSAVNGVRGIVCVTQANMGWGLAERATGVPYFITGNGTGYNNVDAAAAASTTELSHVVAVFDPVAKTHSIYVNGVLSAVKNDVTTVLTATATEAHEGFNMFNVFYMGGDPTTSTGACDFPADNLIIADAKIYVGALTADQVKAAYEAAAANFVPPVTPEGKENVIVDLDFSAITDGIIADLSGNNNFATLTGNATVENGKIIFAENGSYLTIKNCAGLNFAKTESFKIEITFQASEQTVTDAGSGKWPCLLQKGGANNGWWGIWVNGGKQYVWGGLNTTINGASKNNPPFANCDTEEHTVLIIQDAEAGKLYVYVDNELSIEAAAMTYTSNLDLWIGGNVGNKVQQFYGSISKFSVTKYTEKTTDDILVENGYNLEDYVKLNLTPVAKAYYYSSSNSLSNLVTTESNSTNFWATKIFTNAQLPVGSVIVVLPGYQFRPEGWVELDQKNASSARPGNFTDTITVIDEEWYKDFNYRGFNISAAVKDANGNTIPMTEADFGAFAIYVPVVPEEGLVVGTDFEVDNLADLATDKIFTVGTPILKDGALTFVKESYIYVEGAIADVYSVKFDVIGATKTTKVTVTYDGKTTTVYVNGTAVEGAKYINVVDGVLYIGADDTLLAEATIDNLKVYNIVVDATADKPATGDPIVPDGGVNTDPIVPTEPTVPAEPETGDPIVPDIGVNTDPIVPTEPTVPTDPAAGDPIYPAIGTNKPDGDTSDDDDVVVEDASKLYADIDFAVGYMGDAYGRVNLEFVGNNVTVKMVEVKLNGVTKTVPALRIEDDAASSWVKGTLTQFTSNTQFDNFVESKGGWSVEAFYVNAQKTDVQGIVCVTEGNGSNGRQGWGIADNAGKPYFLTGSGKANGNKYFSTGVGATQTDAVNLVHVVGVYDAVANKNYLYINGVKIKELADVTAFACANEMEKGNLIPAEDKFNMYNVFYIGADPTVNSGYAADYTSKDLTVVDVKLYAGALTAEEVTAAYNTAIAAFAE